MANNTLGLKNVNILSRDKYNEIPQPGEDELWCIGIENYTDGVSWCRIYPDGWCEQGGHIDESNVNVVVVTFLKPFSEVPTLLTSAGGGSRTSYLDNGIDVFNLTNTSFTKQYVANVGTGWSWYACGYIL